MITATLYIIAVLAIVAVHFLIPLPLLSYQQGDIKTDHGEVTKVESIRPGVFEVSLTQGMEIDPRLQQGSTRMTSASCTRFVHFRQGQTLPRIGDKVSVSSTNRLHHFTGRSFNWAKGWEPIQGTLPSGGKVELVTA
mgnify:CR=1 FL=1